MRHSPFGYFWLTCLLSTLLVSCSAVSRKEPLERSPDSFAVDEDDQLDIQGGSGNED